MPNANPTPEIVRFGVFEADLHSRELRRNGRKVSLQGLPFQVFAILLQQSGRLVTREELREKVWPADTFVDFDHGLNTAITKIRMALGDSADNPRFVETLPRRGYRFIAPVENTVANVREPGTSAVVKQIPSKAHFRVLSALPTWAVVGTALLAVLSAAAVWFSVQRRADSRRPSLEVVPVVAVEGKQASPALSPDGNQVAFTQYDGEEGLGIYTTIIGSDKVLRLTNNSGDCCPTWSPDNRTIAFIRYSTEGTSIYVVSAIGGTERKLYAGVSSVGAKAARARNRLLLNGQGISLSWSVDGKILAFPECLPGEVRTRIAFLSLADLSVRPFTSPPNQESDDGPAFSPDGSMLAFARGGTGGGGRDLFVAPVTGGQPKRITFGNSGGSPVWTQDGSDLVFSSARERGLLGLWRISASGGKASPVIGLNGVAFSPSISRTGNQLVYQHFVSSDNIWRVNLKDERHSIDPAVRVISARGINWRPSFSPDGKRLAFESDRLGYSDIWDCDSDGSNCAQVTSLHGTAGTARWSPDGRNIAFECQSQNYYQVYVVEVPGGSPHVVPTFPNSDNGAPNWSRDGQWIYFYSDHEKGPVQLWKVPFKGGVPIRVTNNGGVYATESDDQRFLYYSKLEEPGIWKMPINGGEEERILDQPEAWYWHSWTLGHSGVYFLELTDTPTGRIVFFDFRTQRRTALLNLEKPASTYGGLALSPDGKSLLYGQSEFQESSIMLVRNFH